MKPKYIKEIIIDPEAYNDKLVKIKGIILVNIKNEAYLFDDEDKAHIIKVHLTRRQLEKLHLPAILGGGSVRHELEAEITGKIKYNKDEDPSVSIGELVTILGTNRIGSGASKEYVTNYEPEDSIEIDFRVLECGSRKHLCGPLSCFMAVSTLGIKFNLRKLIRMTDCRKDGGVAMQKLSTMMNRQGLDSTYINGATLGDLCRLIDSSSKPIIAALNSFGDGVYPVVVDRQFRIANTKYFMIRDPRKGETHCNLSMFAEDWSDGELIHF